MSAFFWITIFGVLCGVTNGQYAVGEPMAEPETVLTSQPNSTAMDIFDVLDRGGFVQSATSSLNLTSLASCVTLTNVTYPFDGVGSEYLVDVKAQRWTPSSDEAFLTIKNRVKVVIRSTSSSLEANLSRVIAMSEFHSTTPAMFGAVRTRDEAAQPAVNCAEERNDCSWTHMIPDDVAAISLHVVEEAKSNQTGIPRSSSHAVRPFSGSVRYTVDLKGRYAPIFKAVTALPGRVTNWNFGCAWWDRRHRSWDLGGCALEQSPLNESTQTCECVRNQTSTYTLLFAVEKQTKVSSLVLAMCMAFESVSVISLLIALTTLLCLRRSLKAASEESMRPRSDTVNHINLCAALVLLHVSVLLRPLAILTDWSCMLIAALTHYFLLVSGAWMLAEGVFLYRRTCSSALFVREATDWRWIFTMVVLPWLCPALWVGFCFGYYMPIGGYMARSVEYDLMMRLRMITRPSRGELALTPEYPKYSLCWLNPTMNYAAAVPIAIMIFPNIVIAILVATRVWRIKKLDSSRRRPQRSERGSMRNRPLTAMPSTAATKQIRSQPMVASFRAFVILLPVLGVPWIGTFVGVVPGAESYITALHLLASSLQGLLVACVVCLVNRDVRKALLRKLRPKCARFFNGKVGADPRLELA